MIDFAVLDLERATDASYGVIKGKILNGELVGGERLDVDEIAKQMGVSRTPIMNALQRLATQGLIDIKARKGSFVRRVEPRQLEETFEVREALETKACELLCGKLTPTQETELKQINEKMRNPKLTRLEHV